MKKEQAENKLNIAIDKMIDIQSSGSFEKQGYAIQRILDMLNELRASITNI